MIEALSLLEDKIFNYFLSKLECYFSNKNISNDNFKISMLKWAGDRLDSPIYFNEYVKEFFEPELNITGKELLITLRNHRITFSQYIMGILGKYDVRQNLIANNILKESAIFEDTTEEEEDAAKKIAIKQALGTENINLDNTTSEELDSLLVKAETDENEETTTEDKQKTVQSLLGDNVDTSNLSDEELDSIMSKLVSIEEKLNTLKSYNLDKDKFIEYIHKYTNMNKFESELVYNDIIG